ncbi:MAG: ClpP/crotonase-like domain-containing protein [Monoraphidium minutum]|nr:MAG: ClpP/crotonase-like domain-containing protein [Monoraphidium minutum]
MEGLDAGVEWLSAPGAVARAGVRACSAGAGGGEVGVLVLARAAKGNAWNDAMWRDWGEAVRLLETRDTVRVVVLLAEGPLFTGGLDLGHLAATLATHTAPGACPARARLAFRTSITAMQDAYTRLERASWPVVAAVHGACIGAGVDLVTACDLRYCTQDAYFCVKEVDVGITADLGTLQRLPAIVGHGVAAEMALTARRVGGQEAAALGLVARCLPSRRELVVHALAVADDIAAKSPLAVWGTKRVLLQTRDGLGSGVEAGLAGVAAHNAAFLLSDDIARVVQARAAKRPPQFSKL